MNGTHNGGVGGGEGWMGHRTSKITGARLRALIWHSGLCETCQGAFSTQGPHKCVQTLQEPGDHRTESWCPD